MPGHVHWSADIEIASPISHDGSFHCQIEGGSPSRPSSCCSSIDWNEEGRQVQDFLADDYVELFEPHPEHVIPAKTTRSELEYLVRHRRQDIHREDTQKNLTPRIVELKPRRHTPTKFVAAVKFDRKSGKRYVNGYEILQTLGRGAFSTVELCQGKKINPLEKDQNDDSTLYALKTVRKSCLRKLSTGWGPKNNAFTSVKREIAIMKKLDHPNLVSLYQVIDDPTSDKLYMVLEYIDCGPVLRASPLGRWYEPIDELAARACFRDVLQALEYLHAQRIIHYDIKPENILISSNGRAKLCDFGVSKVLGGGKPLGTNIEQQKSACGQIFDKGTKAEQFFATTPAFTAPEMCSPIWQRPTAPASAVDIWGLGASLHAMLTGIPPFLQHNDMNTFEAIAQNQLDLALALSVSSEPVVLRPLLEMLLEKDALKRANVTQAMNSKWTNIYFDILEPTRYTGVSPVTSAEIDSAVSGINKIALATRIKTAMRRAINRTRTRLRSKDTSITPQIPNISSSEKDSFSRHDNSLSSLQDGHQSPALSYVATSFSADHTFTKQFNNRGRFSGLRKQMQRFKHKSANQHTFTAEPASPVSPPVSADDVRWTFSDAPPSISSSHKFLRRSATHHNKRPLQSHFEHRLTDLVENEKQTTASLTTDVEDYERQTAFAALVDRGRAISTPTRGLDLRF